MVATGFDIPFDLNSMTKRASSEFAYKLHEFLKIEGFITLKPGEKHQSEKINNDV
jgi:hypothetical protein